MPNRLLSLFLVFPMLILFAAPVIVRAQLFGISDNDPRWGSWQSAPNFPGIKIRVACGTYDPSGGNSQWSFQFQNTYPKKVYLVYQEEAGDSTGHPPTFDSPGGRNLESGEKSDMYTDYLSGTCAARKQIFIKVNSISDDEGNQTEAKPGASQTSALAGASPDEPKPGKDASGNSGGPKNATPGGNTRALGSVRTSAGGGLAGTLWACTRTYRAGGESHYLQTFIANGPVKSGGSIDSLGGDLIWEQSGTQLIFRNKYGEIEWRGTVSGNSIAGGLPTQDASDSCTLQSALGQSSSAGNSEGQSSSQPIVTGGTWTCRFLFDQDSNTTRIPITFLDGGVTRQGEQLGIFEGANWRQDGSRITITTQDPGRTVFEGVLASPNSLTLQEIPKYSYFGSGTCTR